MTDFVSGPLPQTPEECPLFLADLVRRLETFFAPETTSGVWTPVLWDSSKSDGEGQTYSFQDGYYSLLNGGPLCYISGRLGMSSLGTLTGTQNARMGGLPFAVRDSTAHRGFLIITDADNLSITAGQSVVGIGNDGFAEFIFEVWDSTQGTNAFVINNLTATSVLRFAGMYEILES